MKKFHVKDEDGEVFEVEELDENASATDPTPASKQEVVIATIKEPFHRTQLIQGSLIGITHEINGGMPVDRLTGLVQAIMFLRRFLLEIIACTPVTPCTVIAQQPVSWCYCCWPAY